MRHSRECGAEVREGWTVTGYAVEPTGVRVEARGEDGRSETLRASFLVDASGRGNFTGNQEKLRVVHPDLKKLAVFGHFEGVTLDEGPKRGDTVIVRLHNKWFWIIPISETRTSVGCVMDQKEFAEAREIPAQIFERLWKSSEAMRQRMDGAKLVNAIQTTSDFSYHNRRLASPRLLRVGDAAGFMDPIFSAGVYLAMYSGKLAAETVIEALERGNDGGRLLNKYEKRIFRAMQFYWDMVEAFYTQPFIDLFMEPRRRFHLPDAIVAILAGELDGGWAMGWRRKVFFGLVKIQKRWPLVPPVSFAENGVRRRTISAEI
jgi:FADH2-dependent halogenase